MNMDLLTEPLGQGDDGPVYLRDIWPSSAEIEETIASSVDGEMFARTYGDVYTGDERWNALEIPSGDLYDWRDDSTYVRQPPYFDGMRAEPGGVEGITGAPAPVPLRDSA